MNCEALFPALPSARALSLAAGTEGDPFAFLGPHQVPGGWRITALVPDGSRMSVLVADKARAMTPDPSTPRIGALFVPGAEVLPHYLLREERADGSVTIGEDPWRFWPALPESTDPGPRPGGAELTQCDGVAGCRFVVRAPHAQRVSVIGDFNDWQGWRTPMRFHPASGLWEIFLPAIGEGTLYKFEILGADGVIRAKADPMALRMEHPPGTASVVTAPTDFRWRDAAWCEGRAARQRPDAPLSIFEVHAGSFLTTASGEPLPWEDLTGPLLDHAEALGFTHIELMPLHEHPFGGSWGYQPVGLFAPTARHGSPDGLRAFVDAAHHRGIGVLLDWVPGHFPDDAHGPVFFDGTPLYEYADPREGRHQDWGTLVPDFRRPEVRRWLISNALWWLESFHFDGLRVDAVAAMLYRDYSRGPGQWLPNCHGGPENLEAIAFLRDLNRTVKALHPGCLMIAEESTAFPGVTDAPGDGGLGFDFKWNMGWMNDWLRHLSRDPVHRAWHSGEARFSFHYAGAEAYILPLSHDEVVHGKGALLRKIPGSEADQFATLRAFYAAMWAHPGKKLLFMGQEWGAAAEWDHRRGLDRSLLADPRHAGVQLLLCDLNWLYRGIPALYHDDRGGYQLLPEDHPGHSLNAWLRFTPDAPPVMSLFNMTPIDREVTIPVSAEGQRWREILNSDSHYYGGKNRGNLGVIEARGGGLRLTVPGLSTLWLSPD